LKISLWLKVAHKAFTSFASGANTSGFPDIGDRDSNYITCSISPPSAPRGSALALARYPVWAGRQRRGTDIARLSIEVRRDTDEQELAGQIKSLVKWIFEVTPGITLPPRGSAAQGLAPGQVSCQVDPLKTNRFYDLCNT